MKKEFLLKALSYVDETFTDAAYDAFEAKKKYRYVPPAIKWLSAVAASLVLVIGFWALYPMLFGSKIPLPRYEVAPFTAQELISSVGITDGSTYAYETVVVQNAEELNLIPVPEDEYLPIYSTFEREPVRSELEQFVEKYRSAFETLMGTPITGEIKESLSYDKMTVEGYNFYSDKVGVSFDASTNGEYIYAYTLYPRDYFINEKSFSFNSETTEKEIRTQLAETVKYLGELFGESFDRIDVDKRISSTGEISGIYVYLYSSEKVKNTGFLDAEVKTEYLSLKFSSSSYNKPSTLSSIGYRKDMTDGGYIKESYCKRIPLAEAEANVKDGYTLGGTACDICTALQPPVDFTEYDYVGIDYFDLRNGESIPVYAFYKYIGKTDYGSETYALTYFPAIYVEGIIEAIEARNKRHKEYAQHYSDKEKRELDDWLNISVLDEDTVKKYESSEEENVAWIRNELKFTLPEHIEVYVDENLSGNHTLKGNGSLFFIPGKKVFDITLRENGYIIGLVSVKITKARHEVLCSVSFPKIDGEYQIISDDYVKAFFRGKTDGAESIPVTEDGIRFGKGIEFVEHAKKNSESFEYPLFFYKSVIPKHFPVSVTVRIGEEIHNFFEKVSFYTISEDTDAEIIIKHGGGISTLAIIRFTDDGYEVVRRKEYPITNGKYEAVPEWEIEDFFTEE